MALKLSKRDLNKAARSAQSMRARLKRIRAQTERTTEKIVHTTEVGAAAFVGGFTQGRFGGIHVVGVPLELLLGGVLNLASLTGLGGKMSSHLNGFGDGLLASYLTAVGQGVGRATTAAGGAGGGVSGLFGGRQTAGLGTGGNVLSDAEMAAAVSQAAQGW